MLYEMESAGASDSKHIKVMVMMNVLFLNRWVIRELSVCS